MPSIKEYILYDCLLFQVEYKSPNMETDAIRKALHFLKDKISISEVVTDASRTVMALMGEISLSKIIFRNVTNYNNINLTEKEFSQYIHSLDVWHKSKKLKKCLAKVGIHMQELGT